MCYTCMFPQMEAVLSLLLHFCSAYIHKHHPPVLALAQCLQQSTGERQFRVEANERATIGLLL